MSRNERVIAAIPARYESTRFPGKPLASILDRPMIQWVIEGVSEASLVDHILVGTDDERIYEAVDETAAEPVMTSGNISSGSDRVAKAVQDRSAELVLNVQGDEPLIRGEILDRGIRTMIDDPSVEMGSFMTEATAERRGDSDVVKVVVDNDNRALYFSRSPVPSYREEAAPTYEHVGIYLFRKEFLQTYSSLDPTPLERCEQLEQLRALENGYDIKMVEIDETTVGVDRPEDIEVVEEILKKREPSSGQ